MGLEEIELQMLGGNKFGDSGKQVGHFGLGLGHNIGQYRIHHRSDEGFAIAKVFGFEHYFAGDRIPDHRPLHIGKQFQLIPHLGAIAAFVLLGRKIAKTGDTYRSGDFHQVD